MSTLNTGTIKLNSVDFFEQIERLEGEVKKAFWAGFEIAYCTTDLNIQPRWIEYKELRGLK